MNLSDKQYEFIQNIQNCEDIDDRLSDFDCKRISIIQQIRKLFPNENINLFEPNLTQFLINVLAEVVDRKTSLPNLEDMGIEIITGSFRVAD